ncbi:MAG: hypothetical protein GXP33_16725 [Spirochaetes bacterium]|nr:hypothetical protein [Spirochaetota bacterium]
MKNSLILFPLFLFIFIITAVILATLNIFFFWGLNYSSVTGITKAIVLKSVPYKVFQILTASVLNTIVLISFRILKKTPARFTSFMIILATAYLIFIFAVMGTLEIDKNMGEKPQPVFSLIPDKLNSFKNYTVYPINVDGEKLRNVVILDLRDENKKKNKIIYLAGATEKWNREYFMIKDEKNITRVKEKNAYPVVEEIFKKNRFVSLFLDDISFFNTNLANMYNLSKKMFLIFAFAVVFFFSACGVFMRITRWPLFNIFLSFAIVRGFFTFYRWIQLNVVREAVLFFNISHINFLLPSLIIGGIALLLFLLDILFVPYNYWEIEVAE